MLRKSTNKENREAHQVIETLASRQSDTQSTSQAFDYKKYITTNIDLYNQTGSIPLRLVFFNARYKHIYKILNSHNLSPNKLMTSAYYTSRSKDNTSIIDDNGAATDRLLHRRTSTLHLLIQHDLHKIGLRLDDKVSLNALEQCDKDRGKWLCLGPKLKNVYLQELRDLKIYALSLSKPDNNADMDYLFDAQFQAAQDITEISDQDITSLSDKSDYNTIYIHPAPTVPTFSNLTISNKRHTSDTITRDHNISAAYDLTVQSPPRKKANKKNGTESIFKSSSNVNPTYKL